jgi:hypothetical protein
VGRNRPVKAAAPQATVPTSPEFRRRLAEAAALHAWMRGAGVRVAAVGDLRLELDEGIPLDSPEAEKVLKDMVDRMGGGDRKQYATDYDDPDLYPDGEVVNLEATDD